MAVTIDEIIVGDPPEAWAAAGFHVDPDGTSRIGTVRVRLVGRNRGKRILGWSLRDAAPGSLDGATGAGGSLDGLATAASTAAPAPPARHPNGTLAIDHVVVLTPALDRTVAAIGSLGLDVRGTRDADTYGAPMRQVFFRLGEVVLEVVGAPDAEGAGDAGFFGLAHTVEDLDGLAQRLGERLGAVKDAVQPGRRIATLRHRELGMSVATAFMSPAPPGASARAPA